MPDLKKAFTDCVAACFAQLHYREFLDDEAVMNHVIEFFEARVQASGFKLIAEPTDLITNQNQQIDIMVAGCQTSSVFEARVDAAINFLCAVRPEVANICFSGANPSQKENADPVSPSYGAKEAQMKSNSTSAAVEANGDLTPQAAETLDMAFVINEAAEMRSYFLDKISSRSLVKKLKGISIKSYEESKSAKTQGNVKNYFNSLKINNLDSHVVIVSSTFHLPRFIEETQGYLKVAGLNPSRLTFVGAEDRRHPNKAMKSQNYIKSAMFEFYTYLLDVKDLSELTGKKSLG